MSKPTDNSSGLRLISRETGAPAVDLSALVLPLILLDRVPEEVARRQQILPLRLDHDHLFIALGDPNNFGAVDEIAFLTGKKVVAYAAHAAQLASAIDDAYAARRNGELEWRGRKARSGAAQMAIRDAAIRLPTPQPVPIDEAMRAPISAALRHPEPPPSPPGSEPFSAGVSYRAQPPPAARPRPRLLLVDDEPVIRRIVQQALVQRGYEIVEAGGGVEALRLVKELDPDAILLDALLPDVHGFEICKRLKASRRYGHIPIVMVTAVYKGWRMAADLRESYGVAAIVEKPFNLHDLVRVVEDALAGRAASPPDPKELSAEAQRLFSEGSGAYKRGDIDSAIAAMAAAVAIDPLSPVLRHQLGLLYAHRGHDFAAIQELEMSIDLEPERYQVVRNLAVLYQRRGFRRKACEMWERALAVAPDDAARQEIKGILVQLL